MTQYGLVTLMSSNASRWHDRSEKSHFLPSALLAVRSSENPRRSPRPTASVTTLGGEYISPMSTFAPCFARTICRLLARQSCARDKVCTPNLQIARSQGQPASAFCRPSCPPPLSEKSHKPPAALCIHCRRWQICLVSALNKPSALQRPWLQTGTRGLRTKTLKSHGSWARKNWR